jgi:hypothetical protein
MWACGFCTAFRFEGCRLPIRICVCCWVCERARFCPMLVPHKCVVHFGFAISSRYMTSLRLWRCPMLQACNQKSTVEFKTWPPHCIASSGFVVLICFSPFVWRTCPSMLVGCRPLASHTFSSRALCRNPETHCPPKLCKSISLPTGHRCIRF